ncbi:hypothetical protein F511_40232 [Dorcoceras hygrometricum]|uniref:Uncharacterized protein n=1 Tax=Dorcoceras hygrometricum TaxID=472368 RepID=A0A2Z7B0E7_9LAMI|nr:hypothetical protein F511_40232 [Dorcoceras hygrometricum]
MKFEPAFYRIRTQGSFLVSVRAYKKQWEVRLPSVRLIIRRQMNKLREPSRP